MDFFFVHLDFFDAILLNCEADFIVYLCVNLFDQLLRYITLISQCIRGSSSDVIMIFLFIYSSEKMCFYSKGVLDHTKYLNLNIK